MDRVPSVKEGRVSEVKKGSDTEKDKRERLKESEKEKRKGIQEVDQRECQGRWIMIKADRRCVLQTRLLAFAWV